MEKTQCTDQFFLIQQADAIRCINNWKDVQSALLAELGGTQLNTCPLTINAFTFNLKDLKELLGDIDNYNLRTLTNQVNAVRFYMSIETFPAVPAAPEVGLIVVAVSNFHPNTIERSGGDDVLWLGTEGGTDIHNFSYPCPTTCATAGHTIMDYLQG